MLLSTGKFLVSISLISVHHFCQFLWTVAIRDNTATLSWQQQCTEIYTVSRCFFLPYGEVNLVTHHPCYSSEQCNSKGCIRTDFPTHWFVSYRISTLLVDTERRFAACYGCLDQNARLMFMHVLKSQCNFWQTNTDQGSGRIKQVVCFLFKTQQNEEKKREQLRKMSILCPISLICKCLLWSNYVPA